MAAFSERNTSAHMLDTIPAETLRSEHQSLLMVMEDLSWRPSNFRLLRGLTPWLDSQQAEHVLLLTRRRRKETWRSPPLVVDYQELVYWEPASGIYQGTSWKGDGLPWEDIAHAFRLEPLGLVEYVARRTGAAVVSNAWPMRLSIHYVEKPWGREGWYTGIESRGVSLVESSTGKTELPYVLGMMPEPLLGMESATPILLKTLEPNPQEPQGDLYLEVHREKWESYIVLEVDPQAWPKGDGMLLAGLDKAAIGRFRRTHGDKWEKPLVHEMRLAIGKYEAVRRQIDQHTHPDAPAVEEGQDPLPPPPPTPVPPELWAEEVRLRTEVESFMGKIPLQPGDVICLPAGVIHSLRHGVKVIEFQTPTYERMIAMFAQKVRTQPHWDTDAALAHMIKTPFENTLPLLQEEREGLVRERVVQFPEFVVDRLQLTAGSTYTSGTEGGRDYHLLFVLQGHGELLAGRQEVFPLAPYQAFLLPAQMGAYRLVANPDQPLSVLVATPKTENT